MENKTIPNANSLFRGVLPPPCHPAPSSLPSAPSRLCVLHFHILQPRTDGAVGISQEVESGTHPPLPQCLIHHLTPPKLLELTGDFATLLFFLASRAIALLAAANPAPALGDLLACRCRVRGGPNHSPFPPPETNRRVVAECHHSQPYVQFCHTPASPWLKSPHPTRIHNPLRSRPLRAKPPFAAEPSHPCSSGIQSAPQTMGDSSE